MSEILPIELHALGLAVLLLAGCGGPEPQADAPPFRPLLAGGTPQPGCDTPPEPGDLGLARCREVSSEYRAGQVSAGGPALRSLRRKRTADSLRSAAAFHLLSGQEGGASRSVELLEEAIALEPRRGDLRTDLAAALLAQADEDDRPESAVRALDEADNALELEPGDPAASFDRGLALQALNLRSEARAQWRALGLENPVITELAAALEGKAGATHQATARTVDPKGGADDPPGGLPDDPGEVSHWLENTLQVRWPEAVLAGRTAEADQLAESASRAGLWLEARVGDSMAAEDAELALSLTAAESLRLAEALGRFRRGRELYRKRETRAAREVLEEAGRALERAGSPTALWARYYAAVTWYWDDMSLAARDLGLLESGERLDRYPRLAAHLHWMQGLLHQEHGRTHRAIERYRRAASGLREQGLPGDAAFVRTLVADALFQIGEEVESWRELHWALRDAEAFDGLELLQAVWTEAAEATERLGLPETALYFADEAVRVAHRSGVSVAITEALRDRAERRRSAGDASGASSDLREARDWMTRTEDPASRRRLEAAILVSESRIARGRWADEAVPRLSRALDYYRSLEDRVLLPDLLRERAELYLSYGRPDRATADLDEALELLEAFRVDELPARSRASFLDGAREAYEERIELAVAAAAPPLELLQLADRARRRAWTEGGLGGGTDIRSLAETLPPDTAVVGWFSLEDRLLSWVIADGEILARDAALEREALQGRIEEWVAALRRNGPRAAEARAEAVTEALLGPLARALEGRSLVLFSVDPVLGPVPTGFLRLPGTNAFLVETTASAAVPYLAGLGGGGRDLPAPRSALLVADPSFDRLEHPTLDRLPFSLETAAALQARYERAQLLAADEATPAALRQALGGGWEVVHLASHARGDEIRGLEPGFVLAAELDGPGLFGATQLAGLDLSTTRLVVLAACSTGVARRTAGGDLLHLGQPFLASGAASALVTLWPIRDRESGPFLLELHRQILTGASPADALRTVQLRLLDVEEPLPIDGAAFQLLVNPKR